ncbi:hypothetical protein [Maritimibacter sp. UBA3975]|uniref:hypothetical protein n=1 Tax=Maritimibacter sp. UBA3975 TaxID=1946833 RepID=UPI0025BDCF8F|nr:hypothetical protein [Maritimibacter sp. UBA3975]|tara:strand:- start:4240 stop:4416 length:177 start_codon:yes stop_codon:yes gene_type:complete
MTNVIDFTAYRAAKAPKASNGEKFQNNVVSIADWKDAAHARRNVHVTTDVLASIGSAC